MVGGSEGLSQPRSRQLHPASQQFSAPPIAERQDRTRSGSREHEREDLLPESQRPAEEMKNRDIKKLVDKELKDSLSADAVKVIKRNSLDLAAKIEQLQKTNARISKLEAVCRRATNLSQFLLRLLSGTPCSHLKRHEHGQSRLRKALRYGRRVNSCTCLF